MNKKYTLDNIRNLNKIIVMLNAICFLSAIILKVFRIYENIPSGIIILLGILLFFSVTQIKNFTYFKDTMNEVTFFYSVIFVSDMFYVGTLFFQVGRLFIRSFLR